MKQESVEIEKPKIVEIPKIEVQNFEPKAMDLASSILGDLLTYLRTSKLMSTLMICRQIEKLEIQENTVVIFAENDEINELWQNEKHKVELEKFFKSKGLGFKVEIPQKIVDPTEKLREMFGDKLKIQ